MNRYFLLFILASAGLMNGANIALAQVSLSEDREAVLHRAERFQIVPVAEIVGSFAHVADPFFC